LRIEETDVVEDSARQQRVILQHAADVAAVLLKAHHGNWC
jgi:hypothetical protein